MSPANEVVLKVRADTSDFDRAIRRMRGEVRTLGLAANVALLLAAFIGLLVGFALGLVAS